MWFNDANCRWSDVLQYGTFADEHASRIGYLHGIWRRESVQTALLLELRFFSSANRDDFFGLIDSHFQRYTEMGTDLRMDLVGFGLYDADRESPRALWGSRNVHEEWFFRSEGSAAHSDILDVGSRAPYHGIGAQAVDTVVYHLGSSGRHLVVSGSSRLARGHTSSDVEYL